MRLTSGAILLLLACSYTPGAQPPLFTAEGERHVATLLVIEGNDTATQNNTATKLVNRARGMRGNMAVYVMRNPEDRKLLVLTVWRSREEVANCERDLGNLGVRYDVQFALTQ